MICTMIGSIENPREKGMVKRKSVGNEQQRTRQTHCQSIMVRPMKVTTDAREAKTRGSIDKRILSNYE